MLSYVVFGLGAAGLAAVGLAPRLPFPLELVLGGAAVCFLASFGGAMIMKRHTLTTHRRPKNGGWAALGILCSAVGVIGSVWVLGTQPDPRPARRDGECGEHLRRIVSFYRRKDAAGELSARRPGTLQLVEWMREFGKGEEHVLVCPTDLKYPYLAEDRALYHDDRRPEHEVRARVSYVIRDFQRHPVEGDPAAAWIACCRQGLGDRRATHGDGLFVAFADGSVRLVPRAELGVAAGEPIHAGVRAEHSQLKAMLYVE